MAVTIYDLPGELISLICAYVEWNASLKILRLTSKALFADPARKQLFKNLILYCDVASFDRLKAVSQHPELSQFVRKLTYSGEIVPYYRDWVDDINKWRYTVNVFSFGPQFSCFGCHGSNLYYEGFANRPCQAHQEFYHREYVKHVESQGMVIRQAYEVEHLHAAFLGLTRLHTLEFKVGNMMASDRRIAGDHPCSVAARTCIPRSTRGGYKRHSFQAFRMLSAVASALPDLHIYIATDLNWLYTNNLSGFLSFGDSCHRLRHVRITLRSIFVMGEDESDRERTGTGPGRQGPWSIDRTISHLLENAKSLETLSLSYAWPEQVPDSPSIDRISCFSQLFNTGDLYFKKLTALRLCGMSIGLEQFEDFLAKHSDTLKSLHLQTVNLLRNEETDLRHIIKGTTEKGAAKQPTWFALAHFLRANMRLDLVTFEGPLGDAASLVWEENCDGAKKGCFRSNLQAYVQHKVDDPLIERVVDEIVNCVRSDESWMDTSWSSMTRDEFLDQYS